MQELHRCQEDRHNRKPDTGANAARAPGNLPPVHPLHLHRHGEYISNLMLFQRVDAVGAAIL